MEHGVVEHSLEELRRFYLVSRERNIRRESAISSDRIPFALVNLIIRFFAKPYAVLKIRIHRLRVDS